MDRIGCKRKACVQAVLFRNMGAGLLGALSAFIILCLSVGIVLAEADLTNGRGEIIHYQANPADTQFPAGNFRISGGDLADWAGATAAVSSPERGMVPSRL